MPQSPLHGLLRALGCIVELLLLSGAAQQYSHHRRSGCVSLPVSSVISRREMQPRTAAAYDSDDVQVLPF